MATRRGLLAGSLLIPWLGTAPAPVRAAVPRADRILVVKWTRHLYLMRGETVLWECRVALGKQPKGHKQREGDGRTPEGRYVIDASRADSTYYRALRISYPNRDDRQHAVALGVPPGGQIMIHGLDPAIGRAWREDHWLFNWTNGCIAVRNEEMDIIWGSVVLGTPVEIRP